MSGEIKFSEGIETRAWTEILDSGESGVRVRAIFDAKIVGSLA
jgi:hypothetical protein